MNKMDEYKRIRFGLKEKTSLNNIKKYETISNELKSIYAIKNKNYGDSFGNSIRKYGYIAALTRLSDKFQRLEQLVLDKDLNHDDEPLEDTLMDMANYCIMTVMELRDSE